MKETTTDLERIKKGNCVFTWGRVTHIHEIGPYTLVESVGRRDNTNTGQTTFHIYVDGKDAHCSTNTIDEGLVTAICIKYTGMNYGTKAAHFILKGLGAL